MAQQIKAESALYVGPPDNATKITEIRLYTSTVDVGSLADGVGETKTFTATGAELGDFVLVAAPVDLEDLIVTAYVQAADAVEIRVQNENAGAAVDLASGTWKVLVIKAAAVS
jgi:hypothetical protein